MKEKKAILAIMLIAASLLISSCDLPSIGNRDGTDPNQIKLNEFRKGDDGATLEFLDKLPPDQLIDGDILNTVLKVHNKGAADIEYGKVILATTDSNVVVTPMVREYKLRGKNMYFEQGEMTNTEFEVHVKGAGDLQTTFIAYTCYPYYTKLVDSMCIDPNIGKAVLVDKACEMKDLSYSGGQGGPLAITGVKVSPLFQGERLRLRLNISVSNAAGGKIVQRHIASAECAIDYDWRDDVNEFVDVDVELSDGRAACENHLDDINKPQSRKGNIICTTGAVNKQYASKSPLFITLDYGYVSKQITKSVSISP